MNIQRCTTVGFLACAPLQPLACVHLSHTPPSPADIAKYITKPEPHGFFKDSHELREREDMPPAERYLNARVVSMPEAVHRTWGFDMRAGTGVTHLVTQPPHLRMRALARKPSASTSDDSSSNADSDDDAKLKFSDGTLEEYENRPADDAGDDYWATMLYPDFHRRSAPLLSPSPLSRPLTLAAASLQTTPLPLSVHRPVSQVPSHAGSQSDQDRSYEA